MRKEIIDNQKDLYTMSQFLNEELQNERNKGRLSISSGFFNVGGYQLIRDSLWKFSKQPNFNLRLLFGKEAISIKEDKTTFEELVERLPDTQNELDLQSELNRLDLEWESAKLIDDLIHFLMQDKVQVRTNKNRFNHSKCYIFDETAAVGSSNLTRAGLVGNVELNAVLYQPSAQRELLDWFERRWAEADDAKADLISVLENSKFGLPLDPFKMYMKLLYEYYRPRLEELQKGKDAGIELLTEFQRDAVTMAERIMDRFGGVIISDSTGLGKTHIGLWLLHNLALKRKKILLIAPKQVKDAVWEQRLLEESIKTKNVTLESTGTDNFDPTDYLDFDVVLIDESHNYRSGSTKRHNNIMKVLAGGKRKQVILMTATPVNNSLMDLYNQLSLITAGDDAHFADLGIADLRTYFNRADRKQLASGVEDIVRLLDEVMIRRTRNFIKENYPNATLNGKPIRFPERKLTKVEYSLTALFGPVYKQVIDTIDNLNMVPYRVDFYRKTAEEKEKEEAEHRASLQKYGLLKRFESSVEAIRKSVDRLLIFYKWFADSLADGKILDNKKFHELLSEYEDQDEEIDDDWFIEKIRAIELEPVRDLDTKRMQRELKEDIKKLQPLKDSLTTIQPWADQKLNALKNVFVKDKVFTTGGKKAVIFTQFVDTANYLYEYLKKEIPDKKIDILVGKTKPEARERILREFAPKSNNPKNKPIEREIDILICSDVLSEGQNLQDANYAINYDLPWNPMKIVQRVGRVDRLTSEFPVVTSAVFFPEKELEDLLGLVIKLSTKIQKAAGTVGVEVSILGEPSSPKNFNAFDRIKKQDSSLIDEMERGAELLPMQTPFQAILSYLKKVGEKELKAIPYGKRSGKNSTDENGLILAYKERKKDDSMHLLYYDFKHAKFEHSEDVTWIFRHAECKEDEPRVMPLEGEQLFTQLKMIDEKARQEILIAVNAPFEARKAAKIKGKNQEKLRLLLYEMFDSAKVTKDDIIPIYQLLARTNYPAWEEEFRQIHEKYLQDQSIGNMITSLNRLFEQFKIKGREMASARQVKPEDLVLVGCMFLVNPSFKEWSRIG